MQTMKRYEVIVNASFYASYIVEAENEEDAAQKAFKKAQPVDCEFIDWTDTEVEEREV